MIRKIVADIAKKRVRKHYEKGIQMLELAVRYQNENVGFALEALTTAEKSFDASFIHDISSFYYRHACFAAQHLLLGRAIEERFKKYANMIPEVRFFLEEQNPLYPKEVFRDEQKYPFFSSYGQQIALAAIASVPFNASGHDASQRALLITKNVSHLVEEEAAILRRFGISAVLSKSDHELGNIAQLQYDSQTVQIGDSFSGYKMSNRRIDTLFGSVVSLAQTAREQAGIGTALKLPKFIPY